MKKFISYFLFLISSLLLFAACDYIAAPLLPRSNTVTNNNKDTLLQNILIEDYTGMACINCPTMASRAEELIAQYGNRVIFMEVNFGGFADPSQWASPYNVWDAETSVGDAYGTLFIGGGAYPNAMVNRLHYPLAHNLTDSSTMGDTALSVLTTKVGSTITTNTAVPGIYIRLSTSFNVATSALNITATTTFLKAYTGNYNLTVLLVQDSIQAPQNDKPAPVANYWHRFALRDNITASPWGDAIIIGSAATNQVVSKTYTYTLRASYQSPDNPSKPSIPSNYKQSYVVAFVSDGLSTSPTYYQIMQVQQKKIY